MATVRVCKQVTKWYSWGEALLASTATTKWMALRRYIHGTSTTSSSRALRERHSSTISQRQIRLTRTWWSAVGGSKWLTIGSAVKIGQWMSPLSVSCNALISVAKAVLFTVVPVCVYVCVCLRDNSWILWDMFKKFYGSKMIKRLVKF